ncbi:MAG: (2Fe-2S)-binding protein [Ruegeria sp.]|nr:(2Fe-2S)-binding protein [Ruegeria sp.]
MRKAEILGALEHGHRSVNAIKRNTRCGMGWCNGRSCLHSVSALASQATGEPPQTPMTPRPVARPVTLGELANAPGYEVPDDH